MQRLRSWTDDEETRHYAGQAIYTKTISVAADFLVGGALVLNFGEGTPVAPTHLTNGTRAWLESPVREAARVYVNDQLAGCVWHPPYEVRVTKLLHAGENKIRIEVGNLAINALAGQSLPDYRLLNLRYTERFQPQDMENLRPQPAGLLGPVRIL